MKKLTPALLLIIIALSFILQSCFKERKCETITEEWTDELLELEKELDNWQVAYTQTLDVWGLNSKQEQYLRNEFYRLKRELDSINIQYQNEMECANCSNSHPNFININDYHF